MRSSVSTWLGAGDDGGVAVGLNRGGWGLWADGGCCITDAGVDNGGAWAITDIIWPAGCAAWCDCVDDKHVWFNDDTDWDDDGNIVCWWGFCCCKASWGCNVTTGDAVPWEAPKAGPKNQMNEKITEGMWGESQDSNIENCYTYEWVQSWKPLVMEDTLSL